VHLEKTFGTETPGFRQTEWLGLMTIVEIIRLYAGESWQPDLISLRAPGILPVLGSELFPHAQILSGQTSTYLTLDTHLLGLGPSDCASRLISRIGSDPKVPASTLPSTDLVGSLRQVLETYLQTGYPSLELASEITGLRPRTLQRRLREAGLSYKTLIDNTRFEVASRLLAQSNVRAIDITYATGYRDPSHFSRAFRRMAGCSPLQYRDHFSSPKKPLASRAR
jgi:AraC-like DNA-binding protein